MKANAIIVGLAAILAAGPALGYCRTSHCPATNHDAHVCTPAAADDCGFVVYWSKPRVTYSVQQNGSKQVPLDTVRSTLRAAFATWAAVDCGGEHPRFEVVETDPVPCDRHEYNRDRGNANIILFHDDVWPYGANDGRLALTTVSYDTETGEIYDADMEINSATYQFSTSDTVVDTDLLSVVTHEAGHFLGLAHSPLAEATMFAVYTPQSVTERDLADDDRAAICAARPPGPIDDDCDAMPRHGFSPLCGADQTGPATDGQPVVACCCGDGYTCEKGDCVASGCCAVAPGSAGGAGPEGAALAALGGLLLAARRRVRVSRRS